MNDTVISGCVQVRKLDSVGFVVLFFFYLEKQTLQQKELFSLQFTLLLQVTGVQNWSANSKYTLIFSLIFTVTASSLFITFKWNNLF